MSRFLVYRASAGSGKTYNLVLQYLSIALDGSNDAEIKDRFRHILAITFTNKATNEMKERILSELRYCIDWVPGMKKKMLEDLQRNLFRPKMKQDNPAAIAYDAQQRPLAPVELVQHRANVLQTAILHDYGNLSVCTIDSFMHRVVRTFAHDLHLPLAFAPQIDTDDLTQHAVDELMHNVGNPKMDQLDRILLRFANSQMEGGGSYFSIERNIANLASELFQEDVPQQLQLLKQFDLQDFININDQLNNDNRQSEELISRYAKEACDLILREVSDTSNLFQGSKNCYYRFKKIAEGEYKLDKDNFSKTFIKMVNGDMPLSRQVEVSSATQQRVSDLFNLIMQEASLRRSRALLQQNLFEMSLLNQLQQYVDGWCHDNEILPMCDITRLVFDQVCGEEAPFLFERLGSHYHHIMIDEFQDTSTMQWGSLAPLVCETLSYGSDQQVGSLIVGDGKQAIYRFRQGEVQQFVDLARIGEETHQESAPTVPAHCEKLLERTGNSRVAHTIDLSDNYRSCQQIVRFNNQFFRWLVDTHFPDKSEPNTVSSTSTPSLYAHLEQRPKREGGFVHAFFSNHNECLQRQVFLAIQEAIDKGHYTYQDITILSRKNKYLANLVAYLDTQTLHGEIIPIESPDSLLLSESVVIQLMVSLLKHIVNPDNKSVSLEVLQHLFQLGFIDEIPYTRLLDHEHSHQLEDILGDKGFLIPLDHLRSLPLLDCCEQLLRIFSPEESPLKLCDMQRAYLATFLDAVHRYGKTHRQDLREFVQWADQHMGKLSVKGASSNAIRLMSIHKAKGLESPVVIYYDPTAKPPRSNNIWVSIDPQQQTLSRGLPVGYVTSGNSQEESLFTPEQQREQQASQMDELNSLYVAFTRPRNNLYICSRYVKPKEGSGNLQTYLFDFFSSKSATADSDRDNQQNLYTDPVVVEAHKVEPTLEEEQSACFSIGNLFPFDPDDTNKNKPSAQTHILHRLTYPDWQRRIKIANHSKETLTSLAMGFSATPLTPTDMGNLVHRILSLFENSDDWKSFQQAPLLDGQPVDALALEQVAHVMQSPQCSRFFNPQYRCIREHPMMTYDTDSNKFIEQRADRIVLTPTSTWVVDFKTGQIHSDAHVRQVRQYMETLQHMGYPDVQGYLLYLRPEQEPEIANVSLPTD